MMATILNSAILDSAILHKTLTQTISIWLQLIHSHSTWWWQPSWTLPSWIQPFAQKKTSVIHSDSTWGLQVSWICHPQFSHFVQKNFTHSFSLKLMMATILNSAILDSAILHKTLTQTSSIWLKLIHSHSTWWYQPSWILPCWIQTLLTCIEKPCYLLSDSLKNTLTLFWLWLKLIQSVSNPFILT